MPTEDGPPDLQKFISSIKEKIKNKAKNNKNSEANENEPLVLSCSCDRTYIVDLIVKCSTCKKVVKKKTITRPYEVAALLVVVSYGFGQFIDHAVTDNRYPLDVEYAVMDSCANSHERPLVQQRYEKNKSICLCAFEDTMNEISYARYSIDKKGFLEAFEVNSVNCIKQQG